MRLAMQDIMRKCIDNATTDMHGEVLAEYANTHNVQRMESIGDRVKRRRKARGLTQEKLAELSKVAQATISRIEKEETENPDSMTLRAIARGLGVGLEELLGESAPEPVQSPIQPERERPVAMDPNETESPLEAAIGHAFDKTRHSLRDVDAVRAALRDATQVQLSESDLAEAVTCWLDAAARLRQRGGRVTTESLLVEITREKILRAENDCRADPPPMSKITPKKPGKR
jgi:transcriptional regulator with XRE-family HTH domain